MKDSNNKEFNDLGMKAYLDSVKSRQANIDKFKFKSLMSNIPPINDKLFLEAYNIISSNKSKANSLRQSLLQNISCDNDPNSKVIGFLGELEYDLKSLYDIIKDIQLSQNEEQNNNNNNNNNSQTLVN